MFMNLLRSIPALYIMFALLLSGCKAMDPLFVFIGCKDEKPVKSVELDQIDDSDYSHDDRFQFKKQIEKDEWRKKRYKKSEFQ